MGRCDARAGKCKRILIDASDPIIFDWARPSAFSAVISTDCDFVHLAERIGPPPKVIRIDRCDFPSAIIQRPLRREAARIRNFLESGQAVLTLAVEEESP